MTILGNCPWVVGNQQSPFLHNLSMPQGWRLSGKVLGMSMGFGVSLGLVGRKYIAVSEVLEHRTTSTGVLAGGH